MEPLQILAASGLVIDYGTRNFQHAVPSNLEQAANLLKARTNSASYPQRDGK